MFCTIRGQRIGLGADRPALAGLVALTALLASGSGAWAQQQDSILKQAFKVFGFATDVGPAADFVAKTHPSGDLNYIPVFQPPPEPSRPPLKEPELKAVQSDLEGVAKQHDAIRQAFPPAAKAMAEQQAAQKAKAQKKPSSNAPAQQ
jgi:hypothetical protein